MAAKTKGQRWLARVKRKYDLSEDSLVMAQVVSDTIDVLEDDTLSIAEARLQRVALLKALSLLNLPAEETARPNLTLAQIQRNRRAGHRKAERSA